jgi:hypothetical protein
LAGFHSLTNLYSVKMTRLPGRLPTKTLWILCEGEKTEKVYFQKLKRIERISRLNIAVKASRYKNAVGIVKCAKRIKLSGDFQKGDLICCLFDRDLNTNNELAQAMALANKSGIILVFSNPCFEYWLLCHFGYFFKDYDFPRLKLELESHLKGYSKIDPELYDKTREMIPQAIKNSRKAESVHFNNKIAIVSRDSNPSTRVFALIELIQKFKA